MSTYHVEHSSEHICMFNSTIVQAFIWLFTEGMGFYRTAVSSSFYFKHKNFFEYKGFHFFAL